jgi:hypothetical protein
MRLRFVLCIPFIRSKAAWVRDPAALCFFSSDIKA